MIKISKPRFTLPNLSCLAIPLDLVTIYLFILLKQLQEVVPDYETPFRSDSCKSNDTPNNEVTPCLDPQETTAKSLPKDTNNDYEPLPRPAEYAIAIGAYSNIMRESYINYDMSPLECSEVFNVNYTSTNDDDEEIYADPGYSEADVYACFERKRFHKIKIDGVR